MSKAILALQIIFALVMAMAICHAIAYKRYHRSIEDSDAGSQKDIEDVGHASAAAVENGSQAPSPNVLSIK